MVSTIMLINFLLIVQTDYIKNSIKPNIQESQIISMKNHLNKLASSSNEFMWLPFGLKAINERPSIISPWSVDLSNKHKQFRPIPMLHNYQNAKSSSHSSSSSKSQAGSSAAVSIN